MARAWMAYDADDTAMGDELTDRAAELKTGSANSCGCPIAGTMRSRWISTSARWRPAPLIWATASSAADRHGPAGGRPVLGRPAARALLRLRPGTVRPARAVSDGVFAAGLGLDGADPAGDQPHVAVCGWTRYCRRPMATCTSPMHPWPAAGLPSTFPVPPPPSKGCPRAWCSTAGTGYGCPIWWSRPGCARKLNGTSGPVSLSGNPGMPAPAHPDGEEVQQQTRLAVHR
ncbi:hypothetical protein ABIC21_000450 [Pseudarthrobacter sp. PvP090]